MTDINLVFDKDLNGLAGFDFGRLVFTEQISPFYKDYDEKLYLNFPSNIERVSISFVQGLFFELTSKIGVDKTIENLEIISDHSDLRDKIILRIF